MRRWILITVALVATLSALTYGQWRLRVETSTHLIAPKSLTNLEFTTLIGDGAWVPVAAGDAEQMVGLFNENRRVLARMTTTVFAPQGTWALALAPFARLRCDGHVEDWHLRTTGDALVEKYTARSLGR